MGWLFKLFGGKVSFFVILGIILLVGGMFGYIKYVSAKRAEAELRLVLSEREVQARDRVIEIMREDAALYESRVEEITRSLERLQQNFIRNSQRRREDYQRMTVEDTPGSPVDLQVLEDTANQGMNGLFTEMADMSRPAEPKETSDE